MFPSLFRDLHLQSQSEDVVPNPAGYPQLASGNEAFLHRVLDSHSPEPVPGRHGVRQSQPAQMQRQAHGHQGEDAGAGGGDHEPPRGRGGGGQAGGAAELLSQHVQLYTRGGRIRCRDQNCSAEEDK